MKTGAVVFVLGVDCDTERHAPAVCSVTRLERWRDELETCVSGWLVPPLSFCGRTGEVYLQNPMDDSNQSPSPDRLRELVDTGAVDEAVAVLSRLDAATVESRSRKAALRTLRSLADDQPADVAPLVPALTPFLTDPERPVRLSTAKLFVTLAAADPDAIVDSVPALADRLADDEEFYYVRARSAEALGYVAAAEPSATTPEILADLRIGLAFDEPEVKTKLAKALAHVALGNPRRLRHHVEDLAAHLDSDDDLVRYHLITALVAVGCEYPDVLTAVADALWDRADDSNPYVRGRAAEALGLLGRSDVDLTLPEEWGRDAVESEAAADFLDPRVAFALGDRSAAAVDGVADTAAIRETTEGVVEAITTPDGDGCPHCGLALPENGPPFCPRCGQPF